MHNTTVLLIELGALLFGLGLLGRLSRRIGLSPIPLYLLAGLAFGHGGLIPLSASEEFIAVGAEIGVILLLVMLGLEYSARELIGNLRTNAPAGLLDGVLNAVPGLAFGLLLGWGWVAALVLAGITWVSSSGVIAKVLADLGRLGNRETPVMLSILVIEDLAMALYLPLLTAVLAGTGLIGGAKALSIAVGTVVVVLLVALRYGHAISSFISARDPEALLLGYSASPSSSPVWRRSSRSPRRSARSSSASPSPGRSPTMPRSCSRHCATSSPRCSSCSSGWPQPQPTCHRCCFPRSASPWSRWAQRSSLGTSRRSVPVSRCPVGSGPGWG
ncbi:hypothetical protein Pflav_068950 [Phytohabitans flavus]|uniref:Cation/H+ exchanger transmembrane domain-containing protein n=1 Tax=Phytohabitans flavus TaxID=1076124 RepID=A0A6F8Y318_9ACTN|nr:hypothetical protein Pflav_068950 [Phytohabitans flavus]